MREESDRKFGPIGAAGGEIRLRRLRYSGDRIQRPHAHPVTTITLHLSGGIRERSGREEAESTGLSLTVKPAGVVHSDRYGPGPVSTFQIELGPEFDSGSDGWAGALARWRWIHGGPAIRAAFAILDATRRPESEDAARETLVALLDSLGPGQVEPTESTSPPWFRRALDHLHDGYADGLRVAGVAEDVGVHPVHLTRSFRRWRGCTVSEYLLRLRVREAARLLGTTRRPIAAIAFASGFSDQSHLTRTFRRETGLTPAGYRRLAS